MVNLKKLNIYMNLNFYQILIQALLSWSIPGILVIPYKKTNAGVFYLLLQSINYSDSYHFVSGSLGWGERYIDGAKRETHEEIGLILDTFQYTPFVHSFIYKYLPFHPKSKQKIFLLEIDCNAAISLDSKEIKKYEWCSKDDTLKKIKFPDLKKTFLSVINDTREIAEN